MLKTSSLSDLSPFLLSLISIKTSFGGESVSGNGHVCATILHFAV